MWEKIKAFFSAKATKIVAWIVLFADIVVLFLGGITQTEVASAVELAFIAIAAISGIIVFICERCKK
jgi:hypothetical protein